MMTVLQRRKSRRRLQSDLFPEVSLIELPGKKEEVEQDKFHGTAESCSLRRKKTMRIVKYLNKMSCDQSILVDCSPSY